MVRFRPIVLRNRRHKLLLRFFGRVRMGKPQTVAHAEHVGIHRNRIPAERDGINDIRRLSANARERAEILE